MSVQSERNSTARIDKKWLSSLYKMTVKNALTKNRKKRPSKRQSAATQFLMSNAERTSTSYLAADPPLESRETQTWYRTFCLPSLRMQTEPTPEY